jgi:hypothetical protein
VNTFALNERVSGSASHLWCGDRTNCVASGTDAQLIVHVPFREPVRLSGIAIDATPDFAPTTVKIYANKKALSFGDIDSEQPTFLLRLTIPGDLATIIRLPVTKFNAVTSLFIFVERDDADHVELSSLKFHGVQTQGGADVSQIKKVKEES